VEETVIPAVVILSEFTITTPLGAQLVDIRCIKEEVFPNSVVCMRKT
jgi:hypothetical protein